MVRYIDSSSDSEQEENVKKERASESEQARAEEKKVGSKAESG